MLKVNHKGNFEKTSAYLKNAENLKKKIASKLDRFGAIGVQLLSAATPKDSGLTSMSWRYDIVNSGLGYKIIWSNTNTVDGQDIAILIQYGHGTGTGGYVPAIDYVNPAMKPFFNEVIEEIMQEVSAL